MSKQFRKGQKVKYKVGRGYGSGTFVSSNEGQATIQTNTGATLHRQVSDLLKADEGPVSEEE
jgi:hypothetical protein